MRFPILLVKLSFSITFLAEQLKLKALPPKVIDSIPDLYQPPRPN